MRQTAAEIIDKAAVAGICIVIGHSEGTRCLVVSPGTGLRLALFEPDIPQNTGALLRLAACFGVAVDLIEPCGFLLDDRRLKRATLAFAADDTILLGRESAGVPDEVHCFAAVRVVIPLRPGARSFNVALAGAIAL